MQLLLSARPARWLLGFTLGLLALRPLGATAQTTGNVGIGTTQPTQKLDVDGNLRVRGLSGAGGLPQVKPDGTLGLYSPPARAAATDPYTLRPVLLNTANLQLPGCSSLALSGNTLYATSIDNRRLYAFDVSDPAAPALRGSVPTGIMPYQVVVSGTTAYVVDVMDDVLQTFDVSNPAAMTFLGAVRTNRAPYSIAVNGAIAYVVNGNSNTLQTFDVRNPAAPVPLGTAAAGNSPRCVAVSGTTAYVTNYRGNTLQTFDVRTPAAPALLGTVATDNSPQSLAVSGTTAYVAHYGSNTLQTFDVSSPAAPALLGTVAVGSRLSVAVSGTTAYVLSSNTQELKTFDVRNPAASVQLGTVATTNRTTCLVANGAFAYVGANDGSVQTFRVGSVPALGLQPDGSLGPASPPLLTLSGQQLGLSNSNTVTLPPALGDNLGNHTATQNLNLNGRLLAGGGAQGLSVNGPGHVGIGTLAPRGPLDVATAGDVYLLPDPANSNGQSAFLPGSLYLAPLSAATATAFVQARVPTPTAATNLGLTLRTTNAGALVDALRLDPNGDAAFAGRVTAAAFAPSDQRLKHHIRPLGGALAGLRQLRAVRYQYRPGVPGHPLPAGEQIGLLAQELEQLYPELVLTGPDGYKAVNYAQLTPVLLQALQELAAQNDTLRRQQAAASAALQAQQTQLDALLRRVEAWPGAGTARR